MTTEYIDKAFAEVVSRRGVYQLLMVSKNCVAQYRWKLKRNIHITLDKKLSIIQRAGIRSEHHAEYTHQQVVEIVQFALTCSVHTKTMGPAYVLEKANAIIREKHL